MINLEAQMEYADRYKLWISLSQTFEKHLEVEGCIQAQGLGRLDSELIWADSNVSRLAQMGPLENAIWSDVSYRFTLSRLWVFGGYELIRTLDQALERKWGKLNALKRTFEQIRMPLAKMESPARYPDGFKIARPVLHEQKGVAWNVGEGRFVTRRELADGMLQLLEP